VNFRTAVFRVLASQIGADVGGTFTDLLALVSTPSVQASSLPATMPT
jgi:N-methylhydantoinase A/oxoprolinase/acetone carboxylase beta subunit